MSSIVGHTCGVERAGKAYKLVMTSHRKNLEPMRPAKAVFVLSNYGLMHRGVDLGNSLADFSDSMLVEETVAEELQAKRLHALRRGRIITNDELAVDEEEEETGEEAAGEEAGEEEAGEEAEEAEEVAARREVKWYLPEGLVVSPKPTKLDDKLVGSLIFMRWDAPHGWLVGKVTEMFTPATPRLFAKFNYRVKWIDARALPAPPPAPRSISKDSLRPVPRSRVTDPGANACYVSTLFPHVRYSTVVSRTPPIGVR